MSFILSDEVLNMLCSKCKSYLTVKPIKVYPNRKIKCGRCVEQNDEGVISLYNDIIDSAIFPCKNRHDGCTRLLNVSDIVEHEKNCVSSTYDCPECLNFEGPPVLLIKHWKTTHINNILAIPKFCMDSSKDFNRSYYLYMKNEQYFFVAVEYNSVTKKLMLYATIFGNNARAKKIKYTCNFFSTALISKMVSCCNVLNSVIIHNYINVPILTKSSIFFFELYFDTERISTMKVLPKNFTEIIPIHSLMEKKRNIVGCKECQICQHTLRRHNVTVPICENETKNLVSYHFKCIWKCGTQLSGIDLFNHQLECESQPVRTCPQNECNFEGTYALLERHFTSFHQFYSNAIFKNVTSNYYRLTFTELKYKLQFCNLYIQIMYELIEFKWTLLKSENAVKCKITVIPPLIQKYELIILKNKEEMNTSFIFMEEDTIEICYYG